MSLMYNFNLFEGKIDKTDWNVQELEKKIHENKMGRGTRQEQMEKVPKWSRDQFVDKVIYFLDDDTIDMQICCLLYLYYFSLKQ